VHAPVLHLSLPASSIARSLVCFRKEEDVLPGCWLGVCSLLAFERNMTAFDALFRVDGHCPRRTEWTLADCDVLLRIWASVSWTCVVRCGGGWVLGAVPFRLPLHGSSLFMVSTFFC